MSLSEAFTFLVTTDNHLGYRDDDHIRRKQANLDHTLKSLQTKHSFDRNILIFYNQSTTGKDSFMAFEEALRLARDRTVDFILLGGDLFHVNRPSANVEHKCIKIIRQHMSADIDKELTFGRVGGKFSHFHKLDHANFEDTNLSVSQPILTIHGNHDDPTGPNSQSICEKLATCGLLNYFGAVTPKKKTILVEPIVLQKGLIKIALYGLGFIPDYKLKAAFDNGEVKFESPSEDTFNILVIHQNRIPFQKNRYIPDELLPKFFHLIIRGHEHPAQSPEPIPDSRVRGMVYQPGSTVATSISPMEATPKKVGIFSVELANLKGDMNSLYKMDYELIELKSCRRMIFKDISQKEIFKYIKKTTGGSKVTSTEFQNLSKDYVIKCISELLETNRPRKREENLPADQSKRLSRFDLPLVRLRLEYASKSEKFDEIDVSSQFYPRKVANKDIILFKKQKFNTNDKGTVENATFVGDDNEDENADEFEHINLGEEKRDTIDVMIENFFKDRCESERLQALSLIEYTNAVRGAAEDGNVISKVLNKKKQEVLKKYQAIIAKGDAAKSFHDEESVYRWFVSAFNSEHKVGGDEDMEVIICD